MLILSSFLALRDVNDPVGKANRRFMIMISLFSVHCEYIESSSAVTRKWYPQQVDGKLLMLRHNQETMSTQTLVVIKEPRRVRVARIMSSLYEIAPRT